MQDREGSSLGTLLWGGGDNLPAAANSMETIFDQAESFRKVIEA